MPFISLCTITPAFHSLVTLFCNLKVYIKKMGWFSNRKEYEIILCSSLGTSLIPDSLSRSTHAFLPVGCSFSPVLGWGWLFKEEIGYKSFILLFSYSFFQRAHEFAFTANKLQNNYTLLFYNWNILLDMPGVSRKLFLE